MLRLASSFAASSMALLVQFAKGLLVGSYVCVCVCVKVSPLRAHLTNISAEYNIICSRSIALRI